MAPRENFFSRWQRSQQKEVLCCTLFDKQGGTCRECEALGQPWISGIWDPHSREECAQQVPYLGLQADFWPIQSSAHRVPENKVLEGREPPEQWLIFKDNLLQAQEWCIPVKRRSGKSTRGPVWMNKELLDHSNIKRNVGGYKEG